MKGGNVIQNSQRPKKMLKKKQNSEESMIDKCRLTKSIDENSHSDPPHLIIHDAILIALPTTESLLPIVFVGEEISGKKLQKNYSNNAFFR